MQICALLRVTLEKGVSRVFLREFFPEIIGHLTQCILVNLFLESLELSSWRGHFSVSLLFSILGAFGEDTSILIRNFNFVSPIGGPILGLFVVVLVLGVRALQWYLVTFLLDVAVVGRSTLDIFLNFHGVLLLVS